MKKRNTIQPSLFDYFSETESFSLKEAENLTVKALNKEVNTNANKNDFDYEFEI